MRRILAFSVLACLAASPAFAWGTGSGTGSAGTGASAGLGANGGIAGGSTGTGSIGDHGENDARGGFGPVGQVEGMRWDDELGCVVGLLTRCK